MAAPWSRFNTLLLVLVLLMLGAIVAVLASRTEGGPLDPSEPPASTGLEGRIPISSLPLTIATPGSYVLTRHLTGAGTVDGITVSASHVTIDLNGFALSGSGIPGTQRGIFTTAGASDLVVYNGTVRRWNVGIDSTLSGNVVVHDLIVEQNSAYGLRLGPNGTLVDRVSFRNNNGPGFSGGGGTLRNSEFHVTTGPGLEAGNMLIENNRFYVGFNLTGLLLGSRNHVVNNFIDGGGNPHVPINFVGTGNAVIRNRLVFAASTGDLGNNFLPFDAGVFSNLSY